MASPLRGGASGQQRNKGVKKAVCGVAVNRLCTSSLCVRDPSDLSPAVPAFARVSVAVPRPRQLAWKLDRSLNLLEFMPDCVQPFELCCVAPGVGCE